MENQMDKKMEDEMETTIWGLGLRFRGLRVWVWGFPKLGVPFWGPNNKEYSILGSVLGSPKFGKLLYLLLQVLSGGQSRSRYWAIGLDPDTSRLGRGS